MADWLLAQSGIFVYTALFMMLLGGAVGLPIPEDLPLLMSGVLVQQGTIDLRWAFIVCYIGVMVGDGMIFFVGRKFGPALFNQKWFRSKMTTRRIKRVRLNLEKRSFVMILIARHLFYMRTITFLTCGAVGMRVEKFFIADAIAALISAPIMVGIGYLGAENFHHLLGLFGQARSVTIFGGIVFLIAIGLVFLVRKLRAPEPETENDDQEPAPTSNSETNIHDSVTNGIAGHEQVSKRSTKGGSERITH